MDYVETVDIIHECKELSLEASMVKISRSNFTLYLLGIYRPPNSNIEEALERLSNIIERTKAFKHPMIIMGDINVDILRPDYTTVKFNEMLAAFDFERLPLPPTRVTSTASTSIDCVCTNHYTKNLKLDVLHTGISDHRAQLCHVKFPLTTTSQPRLISRLFHEENLQHLKYILSGNEWQEVHNSRNTDEAYNNFHRLLATSIETACPKRKKRGSKKKCQISYNNKEVFKLKQDFLQAHIRYELSGNNEDKITCAKAKKSYDLKLKSLRQQATKDLIENAQNKSKAIWRVINRERKKQGLKETQIQLQVNGSLVVSPFKVAQHLNTYFTNAADVALSNNNITRTATTKLNTHSFPACNITLSELSPTNEQEIAQIINSFKPKWSAGLDEISPKILKVCCEELLSPLTCIINKSFKEGIFPSGLKCSKVYPKFKKGSTTDPASYRPISLISSFSKVIEKIVLGRLMKHLHDNSLLTENQHGFVKGKSTTTALIHLIESIINQLEEGKQVSGLLLDFSKAFDSLGHDLILSKLGAFGINGSAKSWFKSYLSGRSQVVEMKHTANNTTQYIKSIPTEISRGVPQGSVLGPILFILFTNDLPQYIGDLSTCIMYADDTNLVVSGKNVDRVEELSHQSLTKAYQYCKNNDLIANEAKTKKINFRRRNFITGMNDVAPENKVKLLGMTLDSNLTWTPHIDNLCKTISSGLYAMKRLKQIGDINIAKTAYFGLCESHIRYGLIVWGGTSLGNIERVLILQKKAIRILAELQPLESCRTSFRDLRIMTVVNLYIQEVLLYTVDQDPPHNDNSHSYNTRHASSYAIPQHRLTLYEKQPLYIGCKLHNNLPEDLRRLRGQDLKRELRRWLTDRPFYNLAEYFNSNESRSYMN